MPTDAPPPDRDAKGATIRAERDDLLDNLQAFLDPLMTGLGFVFLVLLFLDFSGLASDAGQRQWLNRAVTVIWGAFIVDFAIRFLVAPSKLRYLRKNWFNALTLVLPFLRPLRVLHAVRAVHSLSLVRLLGGINRGMRGLRRVTHGRQFAYVAGLTTLVTLAAAVGALYFDRGVAEAPIQTFGAALWWAVGIVTTIGNEEYPVSTEARLIGALLSIYAISVVGYVTATIASYLIGRDAAQQGSASSTASSVSPTSSDFAALQAELTGLRADLARLRQELAAREAGSTSTANAASTGQARNPNRPSS